ncbi:magnesium transporter MRS2-I-like protein [Carex littledalei]|uniref:Magnesium transporter MRS2-I-like protein n=1 Tax=Carex littledalei TaxID=544730 RepID=A0A833QGW4_9POAL|nr:magnesium transporter MRS2-I-like protein [Carex littledalei]
MMHKASPPPANHFSAPAMVGFSSYDESSRRRRRHKDSSLKARKCGAQIPFAVLSAILKFWAPFTIVMLRDPTEENVVPVVEELRRRLPLYVLQNDADAPEEHGIIYTLSFAITLEVPQKCPPQNMRKKSGVRDELEQLLDDDDDMGDLYLSRKMTTSPISGYSAPNWVPTSPTIASKISRAS